MAISPFELLRPSQDPLSQVLAGGPSTVLDAIHSAIQVGKNNVDNQQAQARDFLAERRADINLRERRGENMRDQFNKDRSFDETAFQNDRNFGENIFQADRTYNRGVVTSDRAYQANQDQLAVTNSNAADLLQIQKNTNERADESHALDLEKRTTELEDQQKQQQREQEQLRGSDNLFNIDAQKGVVTGVNDQTPVEHLRSFYLENAEAKDPELRARARVAQRKIAELDLASGATLPADIVDEARKRRDEIKALDIAQKQAAPSGTGKTKAQDAHVLAILKQKESAEKRLAVLDKAYPGLLKHLSSNAATAVAPVPGSDWLNQWFTKTPDKK